ncbi:MAG: 3-hydroxyacyl-CoA dehydrogenase NAD-binding domain-containing protein, partial [Methyloligellaceae bacterium]
MNFYKSVAIIGAGTMGHALGVVHALAGCHIRLYDSSQQTLREAEQNIRSALATLVEAGETSVQKAEEAQNQIEFVSALKDAALDADLIIEAISED